MRYVEIKEASDLRPNELMRAEKNPERINIFLNKITNGQAFELNSGGSITIDKSEFDRLKQMLAGPKVPGPSTTVKTTDGQDIRMDNLKKTGDFGGTGQTKTGERKLANRGNTLEGVLGAAAVARLAVRPGRRVSEDDVRRVINSMAKAYPGNGQNTGGTSSFKAKGEAAKFTDSFNLTVKLPKANYTDFADYAFMMQDKDMAGYIRNVIAYVNESGIIDRYARFFEQNGKADNVNIIADGVSEMTGRKTDIFMEYTDAKGKRVTKRFDLSLKAGTTDQFGQAAVGADTATSKKKALSEYGWAAYKTIFGSFGIDVSSVAKNYLNSQTLMEAVDIVYKEAYEKFEKELAGSNDDQEKKFLQQFVLNIKNHGTYNDPNVQLAQFEKSKYYVLDFQKLDRLLERDKLDMGVKLTYTNSRDGTKWPRIEFFNEVDGELFLKIRSKYSPQKMTNLIEKGNYMKTLMKVRGTKN